MQSDVPKRLKQPVVLSVVPDFKRYPDRLQMYRLPPTDNISLEEFEEFAVERLKVLREIETNSIRYKKDSDEYKKNTMKALKELVGVNYKATGEENIKKKSNEIHNERRKDHISHFILRLAYCRSEELRRWFLTQETELFRFRFDFEIDPKAIDSFLEHNNLSYTDISKEEKDRLEIKLKDSGYNLPLQLVQATQYYKVPFTEALDLVRSRKVYLEGGYAYVPRNELSSIISNVFRTNLSHALALTARALPYLEEDERLLPRLTNLSRQYVGQDYSQKKNIAGGKISLDQIDAVAWKSFPLCMRNLHQSLREHHHLKHGGRMQYGLFLKGIGISLEESLIFWRSEFSKVMELDKFDKQYAYNIRHNYGKEGKRADYTPYSCMKIIMSSQPGPGDCHGCPYRHTEPNLLKQRLATHKLGKEGLDQVMNLVKESHYQLACTRYFELTHSTEDMPGFNHPNQYFEESRKILTGNTSSSQDRRSQTPRPIKKENAIKQENTKENELLEELDDSELMEVEGV
ncbi:DNA primase large subunit-like [Actinia tenebrosa]|uniref:DNA primase large subunit n=1 Tax=Actinia tenebrosa TaxID=6105 RepID=A0A6P8H2M6_ACTTE|nr:DNA primase large subunit-like [Actinia tenebrosa]